MIVVFLVDSSASMNQKFSNGMSALECTKSGIEHLVKHLPQVKPAEKHNDKFMLVTYEDGPGCVKSSLKDPLPYLIKELKVLKAHDMSNPGSSLSTIFDVLNVYRVYHGVDTPASGRFPGTIEPSIILWFTDGGRQSAPTGILDRLNIPGITSAGVDYYHEPFRWDQRLYTIFLEPNVEVVDPQLSILSTVMGGTSYRVRTLRHMLQAMDCMLGISKIPPTQYSPQAVLHIYGVVVNFEDLIVDPRRHPNTANHHQLVYVNPSWLNTATRHTGFFPIPEPFWPEADAQRLPTRNAQPTLHYHTKEEKSVDIPEGFPYDKYVVAPCPMTQELLTRPPGSCWPVYIKNSYKTEGFGFPFGFLKANTNKNAVTLTVVAYNYPALFTLLVNLNSTPGRTPTQEWLRDFAEYLSHTPSYYYQPLRNALKRIGLYNIVPPDQGTLSQGISKILNKNKVQAKAELDRYQSTEPTPVVDPLIAKKKSLCANAFDVPRFELISVLSDLKRSFFKELHVLSPASSLSSSLNPSLSLTIPRLPRASQGRMDVLADSDDLHSLPIADMGIYQDRMQKIQQENLRDPFRDEEAAKSLQRTMFGNPYKQDKKVSIDEEDEASAADSVSSNGSSWSSILGRKRKPRRRSVSPSHFPIERIPSLAHGDRAVSGKVQVVSLGPAGRAAIPVLRIMVQDNSGATLSMDKNGDGLGRPMGMHDGEDEDDEDDDFRRAMFNSDEMEMGEEDEAARLRADTPMPGGMGLDDDDDDMENLQLAQELIPPPILPVSLEDIEAEGAASPHFHHRKAGASSLLAEADEEYDRHRQVVKQDLEHLNGSSQPVFESLVYDPSALMELQSIPQMIPERSGVDTTQQQSNGISKTPSPHRASIVPRDAAGNSSKVESTADSTINEPHTDLMPIPILLPPVHNRPSADKPAREGEVDINGDSVISPQDNADNLSGVPGPSVQESVSNGKNAEVDKSTPVPQTLQTEAKALIAPPSVETPAAPVSAAVTAPPSESILKETPLEVKNSVIKQLRMGPTSYNEDAIVRMIWRVDGASNWTKEQKRSVVTACLGIAKGLRRGAVVSVLETIQRRAK